MRGPLADITGPRPGSPPWPQEALRLAGGELDLGRYATLASLIPEDFYILAPDLGVEVAADGTSVESQADVRARAELGYATSANRPDLAADESHLEYLGDDLLYSDDAGLAVIGQGAARTVLIVYEDDESSSGQISLAWSNEAGEERWLLTGSGRVYSTTTDDAKFGAATCPGGRPIWIVEDADDLTRIVDGVSATTGAAGGVGAATIVCVGGLRYTPAPEVSPQQVSYLVGGIRFLIVGPSALDAPTRAAVEAELATLGVIV